MSTFDITQIFAEFPEIDGTCVQSIATEFQKSTYCADSMASSPIQAVCSEACIADVVKIMGTACGEDLVEIAKVYPVVLREQCQSVVRVTTTTATERMVETNTAPFVKPTESTRSSATIQSFGLLSLLAFL
jgi:hypothetical protein